MFNKLLGVKIAVGLWIVDNGKVVVVVIAACVFTCVVTSLFFINAPLKERIVYRDTEFNEPSYDGTEASTSGAIKEPESQYGAASTIPFNPSPSPRPSPYYSSYQYKITHVDCVTVYTVRDNLIRVDETWISGVIETYIFDVDAQVSYYTRDGGENWEKAPYYIFSYLVQHALDFNKYYRPNPNFEEYYIDDIGNVIHFYEDVKLNPYLPDSLFKVS